MEANRVLPIEETEIPARLGSEAEGVASRIRFLKERARGNLRWATGGFAMSFSSFVMAAEAIHSNNAFLLAVLVITGSVHLGLVVLNLEDVAEKRSEASALTTVLAAEAIAQSKQSPSNV